MTPETIAHYRISAKLGEGAMGEVYRATDSKLGREVAIKLIPEDFARDAQRMARFTREAQVLASLNHPNIAAIYGVEDRALIMELVEGPTLAERIKQGPIPLEEALEIARQIADGLEAAHDKGVVHRDLKPANIKMTPSGTIKLLDFGLAKADNPWAAPIEDSPTLTVATTGAGMILGTPGYMAPEQARGKIVDKRADIWAYGVILYEMLTGTQLFKGETVTDILASVVRQDPDLSRVPAKVRPLLARCLEKDAKRRLRDIGDAALLLNHATAPAAASTTGGTLRWLLVGLAGLLLVALAWVSYVHFRETPPAVETVRFPIWPAELSPIGSGVFAISPNGRYVAFGAFAADGVPRIWLRPLDQLAARPLQGGEINRSSLALFWSPDSRSLAYWADEKLKRIDISGGSPQTIADIPGNAVGGSWNRDGIIILGGGQGVMQVPAAGGTLSAVTKAPAGSSGHFLPHFLPDGRHFLYLRAGAAGSRAVYVGSLDAKPEEQSDTPLLKGDFAAAYAPGPDPNVGQLLYMRDRTLLAQPFDAGRRELSGEPAPVAEQLVVSAGLGLGYFSTSDTGTLTYFTGISGNSHLTWFNREGQTGATPVEPSRLGGAVKLSPGGTRAAIVRVDEANSPDIWQIDLVKGLSTRFTFDAAGDFAPTWSPDGSRIAWQSVRDGSPGLYSKPSDGSGNDELLYKFSAGPPPALTDWTRDGRYLVYAYGSDIWALTVAEGTPETRKPVRLVQGDRNQLGAYVSPDQRWVAYMSNESGRQDLYVQPFAPGSNSAGQPVGGKWMVSNGTLGMARWRDDGKELLFLGTDGGVMAVDLAPGPVFNASAPKLLFQLPRVVLTMSPNPGTIVDVTRDHQRFLVALPIVDPTGGLIVALNWQSLLRK
ncbi:MAG TPA: protein kinase [Vicinamibacterales bacterium]|nr:protein kinase [Vicinamibacterales bacterium]